MAMIRVKDIATGKTGQMPEENFNPQKYERLNNEKRPLGGAIPPVLGILGGLGGTAIGAPTGPGAVVTGAAGTAAGTGAGYAIENIIQDIMGTQKETPMEQVKQAGKDTAGSALGDLLFGTGGKFLSKIPGVKQVGKYFTDELPGMINRISFESLDKSLPKALRGEAKYAALKEAQKNADPALMNMDDNLLPAKKQLGQWMAENDITGTAKSLLKQSTAALSPEVPGSITNQVKEKISKLPGVPPIRDIMMDAMQRVEKDVTKDSDVAKILPLIEDKMKKYIADAKKTNPWTALDEFVKKVDAENKGKQAEQFTTLERQLNSSIADRARQALRDADPTGEIGRLKEIQSFWIALQNVSGEKASKSLFTRGDVIPLVIGGAALQSVPGAAMSVAATKVPFSPGIMSPLASGIYKSAPVVGDSAQLATRAGAQESGRNYVNDLFPKNGRSW